MAAYGDLGIAALAFPALAVSGPAALSGPERGAVLLRGARLVCESAGLEVDAFAVPLVADLVFAEKARPEWGGTSDVDSEPVSVLAARAVTLSVALSVAPPAERRLGLDDICSAVP